MALGSTILIHDHCSASVSVVIPAYNSETYLGFTIESVLAQTIQPVEILVVDDGSTDATRQVIDQFHSAVKLIEKPHTGLGDTLNRGMAEARGEYLAFLDADDLWVADKLERQLSAIQAPGVDMVFGHMRQFISPELNEQDARTLQCSNEPIPGYSRCTLLLRNETFHRVGWFATHYRVGEFIEWYSRAKDLKLQSLLLPEVLAHRRHHKNNMTSGITANAIDYARIMKANLARRRSNPSS